MDNTKIYENIIEITWMFDQLEKAGLIKSFDELVDEFCTGSDAIKEIIVKIAEDFEREYKDVDWNASDVGYLIKIQEYAKEKLKEKFGKN